MTHKDNLKPRGERPDRIDEMERKLRAIILVELTRLSIATNCAMDALVNLERMLRDEDFAVNKILEDLPFETTKENIISASVQRFYECVDEAGRETSHVLVRLGLATAMRMQTEDQSDADDHAKG